MPGLKAITVNTPPEQAAHIYAQDDAAIYQSIVGADGVFNIGNKFKSTVLSNNKVRVSDGVLCVGGHIGRTEYADYQDATIENGISGQKRNDIIYAKFLTSGDNDTFTLAVKKGISTTGTAADPTMTQGDLYQGAVLREYSLYRVKIENLSVVAVQQMFKIIPTIPELKTQIDTLNADLANKVSSGDIFSFTGFLNNSSTLQIFNLPKSNGAAPYLLSAQIQLKSGVWTDMRSIAEFVQINVNNTQLLVAKATAASYNGYQVRFLCILDK